MSEEISPFVTVLQTRDRGECVEASFMLEAVGIPARTDGRDGIWRVMVDHRHADTARQELIAFEAENVSSVRGNRHGSRTQSGDGTNTLGEKRTKTYQGAWWAVTVYVLAVLSVAFLKRVGSFGIDWMAVGRMNAGDVMAGQWFRNVTALTLHVDAGHVISNLAFGCLFGLFAGRVLGGGVAWLIIVIAGTLGNYANAILQDPSHSSVGASTAVFAALGVLVAHALRPRERDDERLLKRWSPLIAGSVLLALTGVGGPRSDVMAHVTGFIAGGIVGWIGCRVPDRFLRNDHVQMVAGGIGFVLVVAAWWIRLVRSGSIS